MDSKQRTIALMPLFLSIAVAIGFAMGHYFNDTSIAKEEKEQMVKLNAIINYVEGNYVDEVKREDLIEKSISAMLYELDPHSAYIPARKTEQHNEQLQGYFGGVGIQFRIYEDSLMVVRVIENGPSEDAGIMAGDRIVEVDGVEIGKDGLSNQEVLDNLKGQPATPVMLTVFRKGETKTFKVIRDIIQLNSIESYFMLTDDIGYIHLNKFSRTTMLEFLPIVKNLKFQGMKHLVLDLRGNRGGYLDQAVMLADEMLKAGELIVYTEGTHARREDFVATNKGTLEKSNLCLLIDDGSASASEILAGAIQDNDRGFIVGRRTFGKGLVQKPKKFKDGSELRLTVARYYTPTGRSIQKPYGKEIDYEEDYMNRLESGELYKPDSSLFVDSLKYETIYEKRPVYGGGGIMPDYFVPFDSSNMTPSYNVVRYDMEEFVFYYLDSSRNILKTAYPDYKSFGDNYEADSTTINALIDFIRGKHGAFIKDHEIKRSYELIGHQLRTSIASHLYGTIGRIYCLSKRDNVIEKATELLND